MNPTVTLAMIRLTLPPAKQWYKLLAGLGYSNGNYHPGRSVSLGDITTISNAMDALWCVRAMDWSDIAVRRAVVVGAVLPAIRRASQSTKDPRVQERFSALLGWCNGDESLPADLAAQEAIAARKEAVWTAREDDTIHAAVCAALAAGVCVQPHFAWAAVDLVAVAALVSPLGMRGCAAEGEHQRADIIAAFPCVALS